MELRVSCECGKKYRVPEKFAGQSFKCKDCGRKLRVPKLEEASDAGAPFSLTDLAGLDDTSAGATEAPMPQFGGSLGSTPRKTSSGVNLKPRLLIGGGVGAVAVLGVLAWVVADLLNSSDEQPQPVSGLTATPPTTTTAGEFQLGPPGPGESRDLSSDQPQDGPDSPGPIEDIRESNTPQQPVDPVVAAARAWVDEFKPMPPVILPSSRGSFPGEAGLSELPETFLSSGPLRFVVDPGAKIEPRTGLNQQANRFAPTSNRIQVKHPGPPPAGGYPNNMRYQNYLSVPPSDNGVMLTDFYGKLMCVDLVGAARAKPFSGVGQPTALMVDEQGRRGLFRYGNYRVVEVELESGRELGSWRVVPEAASADQPGQIVGAYRVNEQRLCVVDDRGVLSVIDTRQNLMVMSGQQILLPRDSLFHHRSADGRYLVCLEGRAMGRFAILMVDMTTGRVVHEFVLDQNDIHTYCVDLERNRVACSSRSIISVYDLRTGEQLSRSLLGEGPLGTIWGWIDDRYLLMRGQNLGHMFLVDSQTGRTLWKYVFRLNLAPVTYGGRVWGYRHELPDRSEVALFSFDLPHPKAAREIERAAGEESGFDLEPGMTVGLRVEGSVPAADLVRTEMRAALEAKGFTVSDRAPMTMRISAERSDRVQDYAVYRRGQRPSVITIHHPRLTYRCEWIDEQGTSRWHRKHFISSDLGVRAASEIGEREGKSIQRVIEESMLINQITVFDFPDHLLKRWYGGPLGETEVDINGRINEKAD
ncbi:MAG: hypothetical protein AAGC44_08905 [Planctomycetota bacterium]